jgi:hypothetical protein
MNEPAPTQFREIYELLVYGDVDFILVGGAAANLLGSPLYTLDVDVVYARTDDNIKKIVTAFARIHPYLRGAPPGLPFKFDAQTIRLGLNFTLTTDLGSIDLLGEVAGGGSYFDLMPFTEVKDPYGVTIRCITLEKLIEVKRAAGRTKDHLMIAHLEVARQEQRRRQNEK